MTVITLISNEIAEKALTGFLQHDRGQGGLRSIHMKISLEKTAQSLTSAVFNLLSGTYSGQSANRRAAIAIMH
jgi:hypothetical protein